MRGQKLVWSACLALSEKTAAQITPDFVHWLWEERMGKIWCDLRALLFQQRQPHRSHQKRILWWRFCFSMLQLVCKNMFLVARILRVVSVETEEPTTYHTDNSTPTFVGCTISLQHLTEQCQSSLDPLRGQNVWCQSGAVREVRLFHIKPGPPRVVKMFHEAWAPRGLKMFDVKLRPLEGSTRLMLSLGPSRGHNVSCQAWTFRGGRRSDVTWALPRTSRPLASLPVIFPRGDKVRGRFECFLFSHSVFASTPNSCRIAFGSLRVSSACFGLVAAAGWLILPLVSVMRQMSTAMFTLLMRCFEVSLFVWMRANGITTCFFTLL